MATEYEAMRELCPECKARLDCFFKDLQTGEVQTWIECPECPFTLGCGLVFKPSDAHAKCLKRLGDWLEGPEVYERRAWE